MLREDFEDHRRLSRLTSVNALNYLRKFLRHIFFAINYQIETS